MDEYDNPDVRPQHLFARKDNIKTINSHTSRLQIPMPPIDNVFSRNDPHKDLVNKQSGHVYRTTTPIPMDKMNDLKAPIEYERLLNGDLTVHNSPANATELKPLHQVISPNATVVIGANVTVHHDSGDPTTLSKHFLQSLTDENVSNATVATVTKAKFERPVTVRTMNSLWQVQTADVEVFLYSAYFDDRPALQSNKIRIIGIANVAIKSLHCLLWYKDQMQPDVSITMLTKIGPRIQPLETSRNRYEPYIFTCDMKQTKGVPTEVSLITPSQLTITSLLKVQQPDKPPPEKQIEVGQCMSVVYWHQDPVKVIEWLELQRILGVGEVTTYINNLSPATTAVFKHYAQEGWLNLYSMPNGRASLPTAPTVASTV